MNLRPLVAQLAPQAISGLARMLLRTVAQPKPGRDVEFDTTQNRIERIEERRRAIDEELARVQHKGGPVIEPTYRVIGEEPPPAHQGSGCTAADETLVVKGHLEGLANGQGGFGVLRTSVERLQQAAQSARALKDEELASRMEALAEKLPAVRTEEEAQALVPTAEALATDAWEMGKKCGQVVGDFLQRAEALAEQFNNGDLSKEEALAELTKEIG